MSTDSPELGEEEEEARWQLLQACQSQAEKHGGDSATVNYFFQRASDSRFAVGHDGKIRVADMNIEDWCRAIVWCSPGIKKKTTLTSVAHKLLSFGQKPEICIPPIEAQSIARVELPNQQQNSALFRPEVTEQGGSSSDPRDLDTRRTKFLRRRRRRQR